MHSTEREPLLRQCSLGGCRQPCIPRFAYCATHAQPEELRHALIATTDALTDLVRLKDGPRDDAYREAKDAAWESARKVLS